MNKDNKINIVFIVPSLIAGGAERVMSYLAQNIDRTKFFPTLLIPGYKKDAVFDVEGIDLVFFNKKRTLHAFYPIFKFILVNKPDIVISSIGHVNTMMGIQSLFFPKTKFIGREANVMSVLNMVEKPKRYYPKFISNIAYRNLDKVVCQSMDMANDLQNIYRFKPGRLTIINNPISEKFQLKTAYKKSKIHQYITVGTLTKRKGHLRILDVLSKTTMLFHYTILGNGEDFEKVMTHAEKLGILDKISHVPFTNDVEEYLYKSDVFLQGSFVEGFPNALLESCAVGTPVLAFKALGGIDEIIENGVNGYIAEDEQDYLTKLEIISNTKWNPSTVRESVMKKYNKGKILDQYESLFLSLTKK